MYNISHIICIQYMKYKIYNIQKLYILCTICNQYMIWIVKICLYFEMNVQIVQKRRLFSILLMKKKRKRKICFPGLLYGWFISNMMHSILVLKSNVFLTRPPSPAQQAFLNYINTLLSKILSFGEFWALSKAHWRRMEKIHS